MEFIFSRCGCVEDFEALDSWNIPDNIMTRDMFEYCSTYPQWYKAKYKIREY